MHGGHWDQACLSVTFSPSASPPLALFLWNSLINLSTSRLSQPQHSWSVPLSHSFSAAYPSTMALLKMNPLPTNSELSTYIFSPDRHWSKFLPYFYPEPKTMAPPVTLKNPWLCLDHTPQPHPVSGLKPGAKYAISTMYIGRRNEQNDSKVLPATLH